MADTFTISPNEQAFQESVCQNRGTNFQPTPTNPQYRNGTLSKIHRGMISMTYSFGGVIALSPTPFDTPFDCLSNVNAAFGTRTDPYRGSSGNSYNGLNGIDSGSNCPTQSGYPAAPPPFVGSPAPWNTGTIPTDGVQPFLVFIFDADPPTAPASTLTTLNWIGGSGVVCVSQYGDERQADFGADCTKLFADLMAQPWGNWDTDTGFNLFYNEPQANIKGSLANISDLDPGDFDLSITTTSSGAGDAVPFAGASGYTSSVGIGFTVGFVGMARNGNEPSSYFIARFQQTAGNSGYVQKGVVFTQYVLTLVSQGTLAPFEVIGHDVALPFPDTNPHPLVNFGNSPLTIDCYIPVIGIDPTTWATSHGLQFGTVTGTT